MIVDTVTLWMWMWATGTLNTRIEELITLNQLLPEDREEGSP